MDPGTGWINWEQALPSAANRKKRVSKRGGVPKTKVVALLKEVCEVTGAKRSDLSRTIYGPGANPARRFTVWVLAESTTLTQREIGQYVNMSGPQVAKTLARLKANLPPPLDHWAFQWEEMCEE